MVGMSPSCPRRPSRCSDGTWSSHEPFFDRGEGEIPRRRLDLGGQVLERGADSRVLTIRIMDRPADAGT
jgi:hypothetical protein